MSLPPASFQVQPSAIGGETGVPGDKSISHRAVLLGAIARGRSSVHGISDGADCAATVACIRALGVPIERPACDTLWIEGVGAHGLRAPAGTLDAGNSGTTLRLLTGLLAGQAFDCVLTGDASLRRRPMGRVAEPLCLMGAEVLTTAGCPPVRVRGGRQLSGIHYQLPVPSAQVKSALLLAGLYARGETCIDEIEPARDHTERMLPAFGCAIVRRGRQVCVAGGQQLRACDIDAPGDFSAAAFFIVAASLAGRDTLVIRDVGVNRTRTGLLQALGSMGAEIELLRPRWRGGEPVADISVRPAPLRGIRVPPALVPAMIDELPVLAVAAAAASGCTRITGAGELRLKESDRISVIARGLRALGIGVQEAPDGLSIEGGTLDGGRVDACGDHRAAMAFAVAGAAARGPVEVSDVANVSTSFPGFVASARAIGMRITGGIGGA